MNRKIQKVLDDYGDYMWLVLCVLVGGACLKYLVFG